MTWLFPHIILLLFNVANAWHDARRIKKHKKIYHAINAGLYLVAVGVCAFAIGGVNPYLFIPGSFFCRLSIFNPVLSVFRGLKWDYVSPERKAVADKVLYRLFGSNGKAPVIISGTLWLLTIATDYIIHLLQFSK